MTRIQMDRLAAQLREIIDELREAPAEALQKGEEDVERFGEAGKLVGSQVFAFSSLQGRVENAVAHLDAIVHTHLEKRRRG